jgi:AcrR family transcriptional regulator
MAPSRSARPTPDREPLTRQRVLTAAVVLADELGLDHLSMRRLGEALGVEAMSIYNHVANKDALLDGMVDAVFAEIEVPGVEVGWRAAMTTRARSAREALRRHRWAIGLLDSRTSPGLETLQHHDRVLGVLRGDGFPLPLAAHAFALLDSYTYGFAVQEAALPFEGPEETADVTGAMVEQMPVDELPHLAEMATDHVLQPGYAFGDEFEWGLELVLDGLDRALRA